MHSARLLTNMKIKLSRKARHESQSSNEMKEKQKRGKNWIVNRRQRHNRMIGANNNTCTHASPSPQLLRFLLHSSSSIHFIEFYRMRVCGSDLHFTIETIDIEICVGCETHPWSSLTILNCFGQMPHNKLHFLHIQIQVDLLYLLYTVRYFSFFPQFVCGRCVHWFKPNKLNTFKWRQSIFNQIIIFIRNTNPWKCWMRQTFKIAFDYYSNYSCISTKVRIKRAKKISKRPQSATLVTFIHPSRQRKRHRLQNVKKIKFKQLQITIFANIKFKRDFKTVKCTHG